MERVALRYTIHGYVYYEMLRVVVSGDVGGLRNCHPDLERALIACLVSRSSVGAGSMERGGEAETGGIGGRDSGGSGR